jgi:hypothetical protein
LNKLAGSVDYQLCASNSINFSWEASLESLSKIEQYSFTPKPLNLEQLLMFLSLKDSCHCLGMGGIPGEVICQQYDIEKDGTVKLKMVIDQLVESFLWS